MFNVDNIKKYNLGIDYSLKFHIKIHAYYKIY